jgi:hypothetical protein
VTADTELARPADVAAIVDHPSADDVVQFSRGLFAPWDYGPGIPRGGNSREAGPVPGKRSDYRRPGGGR